MTAGMCVAGVGKALVYSFAQTFILQSAEKAYPEASD